MNAPLERKDVDQKYKWDLSVIYKDNAAFNADYKKAEALIAEFGKHEKTMCESAEGLYNALVDYYENLIEVLKRNVNYLENKCQGIPRDKTIIRILLPLVFICLTWAAIITGFFVAETTRNTNSVSSHETIEQVGITVDNPQNKDIDLQVNN